MNAIFWQFLVAECKLKLLPRYIQILKLHLADKLEIKRCTSVLFEVIKSLYASQQAVGTILRSTAAVTITRKFRVSPSAKSFVGTRGKGAVPRLSICETAVRCHYFCFRVCRF